MAVEIWIERVSMRKRPSNRAGPSRSAEYRWQDRAWNLPFGQGNVRHSAARDRQNLRQRPLLHCNRSGPILAVPSASRRPTEPFCTAIAIMAKT